MADADEDTIHRVRPGEALADGDEDPSDEAPDFRLINNVFSFIGDDHADPTKQPTLPRRGEKDFEPNPTLLQADALAASRGAMHKALAYPRLHNPKTRIVGVYCPDGRLECEGRRVRAGTQSVGAGAPVGLQDVESAAVYKDEGATDERAAEEGTDLGENRRLTDGSGGKQDWKQKSSFDAGDACVCIPGPRGPHFKNMGRADRFNRIWLLPEEALYLLERGSLDVRWKEDRFQKTRDLGRNNEKAEEEVAEEEEEEEEEQGPAEEWQIPMSLQAAYACLLGSGGLSLERYIVYAGLKRLGYVILRAPNWNEHLTDPGKQDTHLREKSSQGTGTTSTSSFIDIFSRFLTSIFTTRPASYTAHGPVIGLGMHRSYTDIYRSLSLIPTHDATAADPIDHEPPTTIPPFRIAFHVYKPATPFRKSNPGAPDFRLAVVDARTQPTLPSLNALSGLLASTPLDPPRGEKLERSLYMRLRHGWRNVVLAAVDQGVVSYLRISDAGFTEERLYEQKKGIAGGSKYARRRTGAKKGPGR